MLFLFSCDEKASWDLMFFLLCEVIHKLLITLLFWCLVGFLLWPLLFVIPVVNNLENQILLMLLFLVPNAHTPQTMSILKLKGSWTRKQLCWKISLYSVSVTCSAFRLLDVRMPRRKKRWKTWEVLSACGDTEPADAACRRYQHILKYQYLEHPACIRRRCRASCKDKLQTQIQQPDLRNSGQTAHQEGTRWNNAMSYIKIELISNPTEHKHKSQSTTSS